jgi:glycopeptide antibiotics resistance protein
MRNLLSKLLLNQRNGNNSVITVFLKVILPLFGGIIIYLYRFKSPCNLPVYDWIKYNLPDGLWTFAFANCIFYIWQDSTNRKQKKYWFYIPIITSFTFEFTQINLIYGTFDILDLAAYTVGYILAILLYDKPGIKRTFVKVLFKRTA